MVSIVGWHHNGAPAAITQHTNRERLNGKGIHLQGKKAKTKMLRR
jgi:hypothetical protein